MNSLETARRLEALARSRNIDLDRLLADVVEQIDRAERSTAPTATAPTHTIGAAMPIFDRLIEACLVLDRSGQIVEANESCCALVGYARDELVTMALTDLEGGNGVGLMPKGTGSLDANVINEARYRHKDGHLISVLVKRLQLGPDRVALLMLDNSLFKDSERRLREIESIYRGLLDSQIDLVCRYGPDTVLTYVNDAYCAYFGKSREELIGTSYLSLAQVRDPQQVKDRIQAVLRDPTPEVNIVAIYSATGEQRWVQWVDYGILDENGVVTELQAIGRDVTPLFALQQTLADRENMLSAMFAKIPLMLVLSTPKAHYEYVNNYFTTVTGWTASEMSNHPDIMSQFYPDEAYRREVIAFVQTASGEWRDFKTTTRSGTEIDTSWANVLLSDGRILGIGQVITERVELENQRVIARQLELELETEREVRALRDRYTSLVAHELRTPLSLALSSIEMVLNYASRLTPERINDKLGTARDQLIAMGKVIEDALRYNKQQAAQPDYEPRALPLKDACLQIAERFLQMDDFAHTVTVIGDDGAAWCDPNLLDGVMINLLHNAAKYSQPHTEIAIRVQAGDRHWAVSISDQGIGIPEDALARLFQPFFRASNAQGIAGSGFGLSIVEEYVVKMGGTISVTSTVGQGSTFTFTLPNPP